jgi:transposase
MAGKIVCMYNLKQIISLKMQGQSRKSIAKAVGTSKTTVKKYLQLIESNCLDYQLLLSMEDHELEALFNSPPEDMAIRNADMQAMMSYFVKELERVGVTRWVLWGEYRNKHPDGYSYSQFCYYLQQYLKAKSATMHFEHEPGDKMFIDYAGKKLHIVDSHTGEIKDVEVYIATLGYSQYTYVEASMNQKKETFIRSTENALQYFGGVPRVLVCDNLKSAVTKASKYEADLNSDFLDFANHYQTAVLPTRSAKPKDKSLVEKSVSIIYSRIYAKLRDRVFHTLNGLNVAIWEHLVEHNNTLFQGKDYSRFQCFETNEKDQLKPLPAERYQIKEYYQVTVLKNCHVHLHKDKHYYSVPYRYIGEKIKLICTMTTVGIYHKTERIAVHSRDFRPYKYTTIKEHLPSTHQFVADWNPARFIKWAASIHTDVEQYIKKILDSNAYPEQTYKSCVGILSMEKKVGKERLTAACSRANHFNVYNYKVILNILQNKLDYQKPEEENNTQLTLPLHENIRGAEYYKTKFN